MEKKKNVYRDGAARKGRAKAKATRPERPTGKGRIVILIDDVGMNTFQLEPFLRFPGPISFAVLPRLPYSAETVQLIKGASKDYILHQPMEAIANAKVGPGSISVGMGGAEISSILEENLRSLGYPAGMNNHMGSKATADLGTMREVLSFVKERGVFFLDSRTIGGTVVEKAAGLEGLHYWGRDVFLDNSPDRASMELMIAEGKRKAQAKGQAVMIGHVWSAELAQTLIDIFPELVEEGYDLSSITSFITGREDAGPWN